jgi:hypothetical protein
VPNGTRGARARRAILKKQVPRERVVQTRVLVAYEDEYRAYREVIAAGIRLLRPRVEVVTCTPDELQGGGPELFDPQVVICGRPGIVGPGDVPAWVELPMEPELPAKIRVGGRRRTSVNLEIEGLLDVIDEAEKLIRARADRAGLRGPLGRGRSDRPSS